MPSEYAHAWLDLRDIAARGRQTGIDECSSSDIDRRIDVRRAGWVERGGIGEGPMDESVPICRQQYSGTGFVPGRCWNCIGGNFFAFSDRTQRYRDLLLRQPAGSYFDRSCFAVWRPVRSGDPFLYDLHRDTDVEDRVKAFGVARLSDAVGGSHDRGGAHDCVDDPPLFAVTISAELLR